MFECWAHREEPETRLVVEGRAMLPTELGHRDWQPLGPRKPSPETAAEVDRRGFHVFKADEPPPHPDPLETADVSGN